MWRELPDSGSLWVERQALMTLQGGSRGNKFPFLTPLLNPIPTQWSPPEMAAFQAREQGVEHHIPGSREQGVERWGVDLEGQKEGFQA